MAVQNSIIPLIIKSQVLSFFYCLVGTGDPVRNSTKILEMVKQPALLAGLNSFIFSF